MMRTLCILIIISFHFICSAIEIEVSSFAFCADKSYAEVFFRVGGNSIKWDNTLSPQAGVEIVIIFTNKNDEIVAYDKFVLNSPIQDSIHDFLEVKRFGLVVGEYKIKVEVVDIYNNDNSISLEQKLTVNSHSEVLDISDIMILGEFRKDSSSSSLVKNGIYLEPLPYLHSSPSNNELSFYIELYRRSLGVGKELFIQYSIYESQANLDEAKPLMVKYKSLNNRTVEALLLSLPVKNMRSGNYILVVKIVDKLKNIITSNQVSFSKSNPEADISYLENYNEELSNSFVQKLVADKMDYLLKAHLPITDQNQVSTLGELIKSNKLKSQRQFIFQYWKSRNKENPELSFNKYIEVVDAVDKKFYSNVGYGFQTDRGHIFLKYGKPSNVITIDTEVDAPPYEIWYYNYMPTTRQTNVRFLFYNPSLAHQDFKLLHSTCIGERSNPSWETELYKSVPLDRIGNAVDATKVNESFNRNARRYFNEY
jgi:GWxTD domain-containing protein